MKSILLASASVLVLAGAAQAEISWAGVATLGYNDGDNTTGDNQGFYWDLEIDVTLSQELDNGLTAGATFGFEAVDDDDGADNNLGQDIGAKDYTLFLESDMGGLYFGNTSFAAETRWQSAGDMEQDAFSEQDGETVLRGDMMFGGVEASVSYAIADADGNEINDVSDESLDQLSVGAVGTFGNFTVGMAYQEESDAPAGFYSENGDFNTDEIFGVFGSTSFGGADVTLAYASNQTDDENSTGIKVAYPFGPVTATVYYVDESNGDANMGLNVAYSDGPIGVTLDLQDDQGTSKWSLEGSYDVGNGLMVYAGVLNQNEADEDYYVAGEYDLGGGAELLVSYGVDDDQDREDEIGVNDYQEGTTVQVSFEF